MANTAFSTVDCKRKNDGSLFTLAPKVASMYPLEKRWTKTLQKKDLWGSGSRNAGKIPSPSSEGLIFSILDSVFSISYKRF